MQSYFSLCMILKKESIFFFQKKQKTKAQIRNAIPHACFVQIKRL